MSGKRFEAGLFPCADQRGITINLDRKATPTEVGLILYAMKRAGVRAMDTRAATIIDDEAVDLEVVERGPNGRPLVDDDGLITRTIEVRWAWEGQ